MTESEIDEIAFYLECLASALDEEAEEILDLLTGLHISEEDSFKVKNSL